MQQTAMSKCSLLSKNDTFTCEDINMISPLATVHGNFTEWGNWTECTATCANGTQQRMRTCTNPPPDNGGANCTGHTNETQQCSRPPCPIHGNFTEWGNWTECTATCANGTQQRMRTCTNPPPDNGGANCTGHTNETQQCSRPPCPIHGNFTEWGNWSECTATCGNGTQQRMRTCTNPPPAIGGANCTGSTNETQQCSRPPCPTAPIDGNFTEWSNWSNCTRTCGNGIQQRMRTCTNPPPANGGANCTGHTNETQHCNPNHCPVNGHWSDWSDWSYCNRPCDTGEEKRTRTCTNPTPQYGGKDCKGHKNESTECNTNVCPVPKSGPIIKLIKNVTSTAVYLQWLRVSSYDLNNATLKGYGIFYRERDKEYSTQQLMTVPSQNTSVVLPRLKKYTDYTLRIFSFTVNGNGIASDPLGFRTDEDVPSVSPSNFRVDVTSSTALMTYWAHIGQPFVHGILLGYNMTAVNRKSGVTRHYTYSVLEKYGDLKDLDKFTEYTVQICGFTSKGCGAKAEQTVTTLEDAPSLPPQNPVAVNFTSLSEITLKWDPVPPDSINGIPRSYTIKYRLYTRMRLRAFTKFSTVNVGAMLRVYTITGLMSFSVYEIQIAVRNGAGEGPFATFYGGKC
ncbi:hypothetical protein QZH41_002662 [Actinostola sp. cb2023]|nr:hypothetical protein QZH41_002662 [Actinostola sp. cb2023]